ncbi:MAG: hypothetical protein AAGA91_15430 [Pseudomonadota bacterium]
MTGLKSASAASLTALGAVVLGLSVALAATAWIYWPGISGPELLDDRSSLMVIGDLEAQPESTWDYIAGDKSGPLGRRVSMATFVLEKRFLGHDISGYKRTNILLHLVNGVLIIWLLAILLRWIGVPRYRSLAVLLGALWLLHPLFVSTVLYAVQRMAMLSTTFMLLTMISYLQWRIRLGSNGMHAWGLLPVGLFFVLGLLSKENTAAVVPVIVLMELWWLQGRSVNGAEVTWLRYSSLAAIVGGALVATLALLMSWDWLAARYVGRPFDLTERLLTQSRILWDYTGQWFYPDVARMGLYHDDYAWSRSLTSPISTLYSLLAWVVVFCASVLMLRSEWGRYLVFGLAWFLLGHSVESTVLPLELYFEHRNYFPAIGLLLMFGTGLAYLIVRFPPVGPPLLAWLAIGAVALAMQTSSQVQIWSSRPLLILHHVNTHPDSPRANIDMAVQLARLGAVDDALDYSTRAYRADPLERHSDYVVRNLALSCIGGAPASRQDIDQVGEQFGGRPLASVTTLGTLMRMLQDDLCPGFDRRYFADHLAGIYLRDKNPATAASNMYANLALLENALERYDRAFAYTQKLLELAPRHRRGLLMHLHFATAIGDQTAIAETLEVLQRLQDTGRLTVRQQQTLSLYLEN